MTPFVYRAPEWANTDPEHDPRRMLTRAEELSRSYYALGAQTGVHAMIEWCGVMSEHVKMLRFAYEEKGLHPDEVDQHGDTKVEVPEFMVEYLCEKLGCQLKPFICGNREAWKRAIDRWFEEVPRGV